MSTFLNDKIHNVYLINMIIVFLSSVIDNVPLVAAAIGMYPLIHTSGTLSPYLMNFTTDGTFWELLAYCAGIGGSILIIGSAAGVVVMGMERINFMWYMKHITWIALLGYLVGKRGIGYIPWYREEYRNLAHVKVEEAQQKLQEQAGRLESAFMNDFVAEIDENVREAKREMDAINRELRHMPFGNDTYKFVMKEKPDRALFFRICRRLEKYMSSPQVYMNSARDDEEMENDIQEFMSIILAEEDEWEYTDYRRYFSYDMEISSRQGQTEITAELSKKQGSASNGEKQTPYFIILAASLLQCYPANTCCARLAFIDEAFSALSRERIEQMVRYFEENHFQVFYAAPPEKINSIGQFIDSTVSLIVTGRYTNAVEGLVKQA